jgi:hypothetical protein
MAIGGRVKDLAALHPGDRPPARPAPQPAQAAGSCGTGRAGTGTWTSAEPRRPPRPPGLRPLLFRNDRGGGLPSPPEGGLEEFREVCASRASISLIRSSAAASSSCAAASSPRSDTTSAASTSYDGCS